MFKLYKDIPKYKEDYYELCAEMWNEIAERGLGCKYESCAVQHYTPMNSCFACEYWNQMHEKIENLKVKCAFGKCCTDDREFEPCHMDLDSPYCKWTHASNDEDRKKYAIEIADLFISELGGIDG